MPYVPLEWHVPKLMIRRKVVTVSLTTTGDKVERRPRKMYPPDRRWCNTCIKWVSVVRHSCA